MISPFGNSAHPVEFECKYCGELQEIRNGQLVVCSCPQSIQAQQLERQRQLNFLRERNNGPR